MTNQLVGRVILALSACAIASSAHAQKCDAQAVLMKESLMIGKQGLDSSNEAAQVSNKMLRLVPPNTSGEEAIGKYMTKAQVEEFGELRSRLIGLELNILVDSEYERDLTVVSGMLNVAQALHEGKNVSKDDSNYAAALGALQSVGYDDTPSHLAGTCNLYTAVDETEVILLAQIKADQASVDSDNLILNAIAKKYHVKAYEIMKAELSSGDSLVATPSFGRIQIQARELQYARNLLRIAYFYKTAQEVHSARVKSMSLYGATPDNIDRVLDEEAKNMNPLDRAYMGVWSVVNEKVPSMERKDNAELAKAMAIFEKH